jgi:hypothetical protein
VSTFARRTLLFTALVGVVYLTLSASPQTDSDVVEPVEPRAATSRSSSTRASEQIDILELKPRRAADATKALFASATWTPPPKRVAPVAAPPPSAPPLPFTYIGKRLEDGVWHVYVSRGDETLIVREQQTIDGTYRIDAVKPPQMILTYLPMDERQTMSIGAGE